MHGSTVFVLFVNELLSLQRVVPAAGNSIFASVTITVHIQSTKTSQIPIGSDPTPTGLYFSERLIQVTCNYTTVANKYITPSRAMCRLGGIAFSSDKKKCTLHPLGYDKWHEDKLMKSRNTTTRTIRFSKKQVIIRLSFVGVTWVNKSSSNDGKLWHQGKLQSPG